MSIKSSPVRATQHGPIEAVAYLRVSTGGQAEKGSGLAQQREAIEAFCARERLRIVRWAADPGLSGTTPLASRRGLLQALDTVRDGPARVLVVARPDRLARDLLEALLIEREFVNAGAGVLYAEASLNGDGDTLRFMRQVLLAAAEFDKRQLVARLAAARKAKAERGEYGGGRPPIGYRGGNGYLEVDDEEAQAVRWVFDRAANHGESIRRIAAALDHAGTLNRRWHPSTIQRVLGNATYKSGAPGLRLVDPRVWNRARLAITRRTR
jgi:site-specific DNA recombinase